MTSALIVPDLHIRSKPGGHDRRSLDAVLAYASDHQWDHVVFLGDVMDHNTLAKQNLGNLRAVDGESLLADYDTANTLLDQFEQATLGAKKVVIQGNHDYRTERLVDAQPTLAGLVETHAGLRLAQRGWAWVPYWETGKTFDLGKASFGHGRYTSTHHAYKHALAYGRNFYYGHTHTTQSFTMERDRSEQYEAASLGMLCLPQGYERGMPNKHQQAFGVFYFLPDGFFQRFTIRLFKNRFICPNGKAYRG